MDFRLSTLDCLKLTNFRSYAEAQFGLGPSTTLVVGPNASGKTNLLEGLYVLASTKSFRARDPELVRHGQDYFRLVAQSGGVEIALGFSLQAGHQTKQVTFGGVKKSLSSHIGTIRAVLFEPGDLYLVAGPPERRRRYLDFMLCQTDRQYLSVLNQYRRVLRQRNSLLAGFRAIRIQDEIFAWDIKLTELAGEIYRRRLELVGFINERIDGLYGEVAGAAVGVQLQYLPSVKSADYRDGFLAALNQNLTTDLAAGFTTIGPHREDFRVDFGTSVITAVASRGEVRTVVLVLKLAELAFNETSGPKPILLLDDVFSELDQSRRRYLMRRIKDHQTIITTTEADAVRGLKADYSVIKTGPG
ncbi:MAG TPA: DNA replication/repair protein RecF [Candidatus Saccharimonadales bacterium]|nr:DNA replication/repair protein RecF [Candidatus Saccharimonadales bacterium]